MLLFRIGSTGETLTVEPPAVQHGFEFAIVGAHGDHFHAGSCVRSCFNDNADRSRVRGHARFDPSKPQHFDVIKR